MLLTAASEGSCLNRDLSVQPTCIQIKITSNLYEIIPDRIYHVASVI